MKKCAICSKEFKNYNSMQKYCSPICATKKRNETRMDLYYKGEDKVISKNCAECKTDFDARANRTKYCSRLCYFKAQKILRVGVGNPAYRNGSRTGGKTVTAKHLGATKKYGKKFVEEHGYKYCEECRTNTSLRFETHHIIFASEKPRHEHLHNERNLILVCIQCHNNFHSGKTKEKRAHLVSQRNLVELFGKSIL